MREILFRGKRIDNGEWVYGYFWSNDVGNSFIRVTKENDEIVLKDYEVISETVGQYTGLNDKNGKRIFEGDIVELYDGETVWHAVVEFGNPNGNYSWGWQLSPLGKVDINTDILCWVEMEESGAYCEVIGTIYDNPELLEAKE